MLTLHASNLLQSLISEYGTLNTTGMTPGPKVSTYDAVPKQKQTYITCIKKIALLPSVINFIPTVSEINKTLLLVCLATFQSIIK